MSEQQERVKRILEHIVREIHGDEVEGLDVFESDRYGIPEGLVNFGGRIDGKRFEASLRIVELDVDDWSDE